MYGHIVFKLLLLVKCKFQVEFMVNQLDLTNGVPKHAQLRQILQSKIEQGYWEVGQLIPRELDLMRDYNLSRFTVRQAIDDLVQAGLLVRYKGRGTFVSRPVVEQKLSRFYSFAHDIAAKGLQPSSRLLSLHQEIADPHTADSLQLFSESDESDTYPSITVIKRLRLVQDEPFIVETSYLITDLFPDLVRFDWNTQIMYDLLQSEYLVKISRAVESLEPVTLNAYDAALLQVKVGLPAFQVERLTYASLPNETSIRPIERRTSLIRGDRYRFRVDLPATELLTEAGNDYAI